VCMVQSPQAATFDQMRRSAPNLAASSFLYEARAFNGIITRRLSFVSHLSAHPSVHVT
jgi:hypothetical protein